MADVTELVTELVTGYVQAGRQGRQAGFFFFKAGAQRPAERFGGVAPPTAQERFACPAKGPLLRRGPFTSTRLHLDRTVYDAGAEEHGTYDRARVGGAR